MPDKDVVEAALRQIEDFHMLLKSEKMTAIEGGHCILGDYYKL